MPTVSAWCCGQSVFRSENLKYSDRIVNYSKLNSPGRLPRQVAAWWQKLLVLVQNNDLYRRAAFVGTFNLPVLAHIALRNLLSPVTGNQLHVFINKHALLAGCSGFWPVNCTNLHKKWGHIARLSGPSVYSISLFCGTGKHQPRGWGKVVIFNGNVLRTLKYSMICLWNFYQDCVFKTVVGCYPARYNSSHKKKTVYNKCILKHLVFKQ